MMTRTDIPPTKLRLDAFQLWDEGWFLLTAGDFNAGRFNPMTVSWGSLGTMWHKPFAQVAVRPSRYTLDLLQAGDSFTLCTFPSKFRRALELCGHDSGRDLDKVKAAGLTPIAGKKVAAPGYREAELILECRKIYADRLRPEGFLSPDISAMYPGQDYHHIFYGEVLAAEGVAKFRAP